MERGSRPGDAALGSPIILVHGGPLTSARDLSAGLIRVSAVLFAIIGLGYLVAPSAMLAIVAVDGASFFVIGSLVDLAASKTASSGPSLATFGGGEVAGRITAMLGSLAFLVLAPGVVAGLVPRLITDWRPLPPGDGPGALRWTGLILIAAGLAVVLESFARFAWEGLGTPAPVAPTRTLVSGGFYRFVRNPMYVAVTALIFGQAILFASWGVALYGVVIAAAFHTFVLLYEEPTLLRAYGEEYAAYCAATPRWIPRFRRWAAG